jgi:hypothetical protein
MRVSILLSNEIWFRGGAVDKSMIVKVAFSMMM